MSIPPVPQQKKKNSIRDLINTGIFAVLYLLVAGLGMAGLFFGPYPLMISLLVSVLLGGIVLMPYFARLERPGYFLGIYSIIALAMMGHAWPTGICLIIFGLAATALLYIDRKRGGIWAILAYAVFSLWYIGPLLPMLFSSQAYFADLAQRHDQAWADAYQAAFTPGMIWGFEIAVFLIALVGGTLGAMAVKSYFKPAGTV